jgi:hypothetical protein
MRAELNSNFKDKGHRQTCFERPGQSIQIFTAIFKVYNGFKKIQTNHPRSAQQDY